MTPHPTPEPATRAARVAARVAEIDAWLGVVVADLVELVQAQLAAGRPRRNHLDIESPCRALLQRDVPLAGAGFVAQEGLFTDAPYWLEWWVCDPRIGAASIRRLAADTDPSSVGFRDYTELPWFVGPRAHGRRQITGPYVDYVCTDQHTLTVTAPVERAGQFAGVAGVDLLAETMARLVEPDLAAVPGECVIVNEAGRVVASADLSVVSGDLMRGLPFQEWFAGRHCASVDGWTFLPSAAGSLGVITRA